MEEAVWLHPGRYKASRKPPTPCANIAPDFKTARDSTILRVRTRWIGLVSSLSCGAGTEYVPEDMDGLTHGQFRPRARAAAGSGGGRGLQALSVIGPTKIQVPSTGSMSSGLDLPCLALPMIARCTG
ncbi:hypothetical protein MPTK1_2g19720 [Marchantia polymorpha subsp. ruderalis]|uniref:Uncharacterized protein n=1 Tax=Marchantia polymorpha TaxID=3197 RepID=A0A2R6WVE6_MARPO|nr:hypothetical protein MARPO_0055s0079 [Marchantia polymorpha]BBN02974.1 hypothetical protein Mp_2g19720 [Marchantia polymorpha subsp. ruderalis]|eukprot:PTQ37816.1 hypothetical protein MARPO_0055s0079 [Marchantia polymorpha]